MRGHTNHPGPADLGLFLVPGPSWRLPASDSREVTRRCGAFESKEEARQALNNMVPELSVANFKGQSIFIFHNQDV